MRPLVIHGAHTLRSGAPTLAYTLHQPEGPSRRAALIAHPFGRLGGCKEDHVVVALAEMLAAEGYAVVRFDARGAGESGGSASWTGAAESADYRELVDDLVLPLLFPNSRPTPSPLAASSTSEPDPVHPYELLLCGYSFGSLAASACPPPAPTPSYSHAQLRTSYLLVSYPLSVLWALTFLRSGPPTAALRSLVERGENCVLAVHGDQDNFSAAEKLRAWVTGLDEVAGAEGVWRAVEVLGGDHFWRDREKKRALLETVRGWVREGGQRGDGRLSEWCRHQGGAVYEVIPT